MDCTCSGASEFSSAGQVHQSTTALVHTSMQQLVSCDLQSTIVCCCSYHMDQACWLPKGCRSHDTGTSRWWVGQWGGRGYL